MATRINIYGGTNLPQDLVDFVSGLTRHLTAIGDVVLVSGGFKESKKYPGRTSVDLAVLREARRQIKNAEDFARRFETWLPAKRLDRPSDEVVRFAEGQVHRIPGTDQARRFHLVKASDGLVTIHGEGNSRTVLELALALEKPALPVAFTGGDSAEIWQRNRKDIIRSLNLQEELVRRLESGPSSPQESDSLAQEVAQAIYAAARKRCLVLMPFGRGHDGFYRGVLRRAIEAASYIPHRIDIDDYAGNIPSLFLSALERSRAVIIDLTGLNPNVMYELGQVHARGINPFLIERLRRSAKSVAEEPFYLRHEKMTRERDDEAGRRKIGDEVKRYLHALADTAGEQRLVP
jgi:hypothetical protein